jgi:hypothetical protein
MPIQSRNLQQAFGDFSTLFAEAEEKNATVHERAMPLLLGAVTYCSVSPQAGQLPGEVRSRALNSWLEMVDEKQGQVLMQADIWKWIRKWFPDPIQGERVPVVIAEWVAKLDI